MSVDAGREQRECECNRLSRRAAPRRRLSGSRAAQVALALFVTGDTAAAARAMSALGALYAREDHAGCMERLIKLNLFMFFFQ